MLRSEPNRSSSTRVGSRSVRSVRLIEIRKASARLSPASPDLGAYGLSSATRMIGPDGVAVGSGVGVDRQAVRATARMLEVILLISPPKVEHLRTMPAPPRKCRVHSRQSHRPPDGSHQWKRS